MFETETDRTNKYDDRSREEWLALAGDWVDRLPSGLQPGDESTSSLWDDAPFESGTKGRWGDLLMSQVTTDEVVYVQPRVGWAGISLCELAVRYGKKLTLFMPASREASAHQLVCIERGAQPVFRRIAAMPVLNKYARDYAAAAGATFVPFGLDHPMVVAAGVASTLQHWGDRPHPTDVVTVVSTGVLTRTLQIAFPNARFHGVAVARNMKDGECGRAAMQSYHRAFLQNASRARELSQYIDSAWNYDMKGFEYMAEGRIDAPRCESTLVWNVAGEIKPQALTAAEVDSDREWGEVR